MKRGQRGETYNVGGNTEMENIRIVETICDLMDDLPEMNGKPSRRTLIAYVQGPLSATTGGMPSMPLNFKTIWDGSRRNLFKLASRRRFHGTWRIPPGLSASGAARIRTGFGNTMRPRE